MSSQYPILGNRPIDQWKVTELKEELKRRKLTIKGLKDDLIRRLDEAIRIEMESAGKDVDNGPQPVVGAKDEQSVPVAAETTKYLADHVGNKNEEPDKVVVQVDINDSVAALDQEKVEEAGFSGTDSGRVEEKLVVHTTTVETSTIVSEIVVSKLALSGQDLEKIETKKESRNPKSQLDNEYSTAQLGNEGSTPQLGNEGLTPQLGNEGLTPQLGNEGSVPQIGSEHFSTPQLGNEGSTPQLGNEGSTPQLGNEGSTPQHGNEGSTPQLGNELFSTPQLGNEGSTPQLGNESSTPQRANEGLKHPETVKLDYSTPNNQVSEVSPISGSQVKSDSISTDSVSINEKIELKDNVITDHVKLELDVVKPEMVEPSFSNVVPVGGESHPMDVEEPHENKASDGEKDDNNTTDADISKKIDSTDVGYSEKLNLDRSSGDDSMEEDVLEGKQIDWKYNSEEVDKSGVPIVKEGSHAAVLEDVLSGERNVQVENESHRAAPVEKRKLDDQTAANNEPIKRQRRWNSEALKVPEPQSTNSTPNTTPKDAFQTTPKDAFQTTPKDSFQSSGLKRNFSRSDSTNSDNTPKERVVPPSQKSPSTSLRIDRFLRPFTLKAVQELLGKTGSVSSFWMDHIKTHCYVTYSSVEEAIETRNAVYNLQWPPNGGRLLVAEFVDPQEVKMRLEAPQTPVMPASSAPIVSLAPPTLQTQPSPSPRQHNRQQLPPPPPLPPPPMSNSPQPRERVHLPPPPPLPEKIDPPIVTLDDLFRKTKSTPRIYYLPLSEEQVAAKLASQGKKTKQSAGVACRKEMYRASRSIQLVDGFGFFREECFDSRLSYI